MTTGLQEVLEFLKISRIPYRVVLCLLRGPAGVVNQGNISATRYRGLYQLKDPDSKQFFAVIDDYKTKFASVAHPRNISKNLFDLFDDHGEFILN